ncbi:unnamed protein product [Parnassius apollo]|uniref:(apollo) hypothetical protein n=1 Tax=Parnassius apollo TaxID=110799 RepID=A0A8S3XT11_PARAO|nr:unnamed protein product [Parnassius apollo]
MSVQRSPTGGSQPDISKMSDLVSDSSITFRKRKLPFGVECACSEELGGMRSELSRISSLLEKYIVSNELILKTMQENITDIKNQIADIKLTNERSHSAMQVKMESLESDLNKLKISSKSAPITLENELILGEQIIQEIQQRKNREKNIVLVGLPEQIASTPEDRLSKDEAEVFKTISSVKESKNRTGSSTIDVHKPSLWYYKLLTFLEKKNDVKGKGLDSLMGDAEVEQQIGRTNQKKLTRERNIEIKKEKQKGTEGKLMHSEYMWARKWKKLVSSEISLRN